MCNNNNKETSEYISRSVIAKCIMLIVKTQYMYVYILYAWEDGLFIVKNSNNMLK